MMRTLTAAIALVLLTACGSSAGYDDLESLADARDCSYDRVRYDNPVADEYVVCDNGTHLYWYSNDSARDTHESIGVAVLGPDAAANIKGPNWAEYDTIGIDW
jgi:hypothetical protein